jgi:hypothetical protein
MQYFHDVIRLCDRVNLSMPEVDRIQYVMEGLLVETLGKLALVDNSTLGKLRDNILKVEFATFRTQTGLQSVNGVSSAVPGDESAIGGQWGALIKKMDRLEELVKSVQRSRAFEPQGFLGMDRPFGAVQARLPRGRCRSDQGFDCNVRRKTYGSPRCWGCGRVGHVGRTCNFGRGSMRATEFWGPGNGGPQARKRLAEFDLKRAGVVEGQLEDDGDKVGSDGGALSVSENLVIIEDRSDVVEVDFVVEGREVPFITIMYDTCPTSLGYSTIPPN